MRKEKILRKEQRKWGKRVQVGNGSKNVSEEHMCAKQTIQQPMLRISLLISYSPPTPTFFVSSSLTATLFVPFTPTTALSLTQLLLQLLLGCRFSIVISSLLPLHMFPIFYYFLFCLRFLICIAIFVIHAGSPPAAT